MNKAPRRGAVIPNIIEEYLVKLGATVDSSSFAHFQNALRESAQLVDANAISMTKSVLKTETALVSGFAAIGGAAIGLADKVAMADQQYRLFGLRMMMSKDAARGLKVAMDALGEDMGALMWDAELRGRTAQLMRDQQAMAPKGDFDEQMKKIRDIRFEFTRLQVEVQYLGMQVIQNFMQALGMGPDALLSKLQWLNDWIIKHIPEISAFITKYFMPVWRDVEMIMLDVWHVIRDLGTAFDNFIGIISGDDSIKGVATVEKFARAVEKVAHWMALVTDFLLKITGLLAGTLAGGTVGGLLGSVIGGIAGIPGGPAGIALGIASGGAIGTGIGAGVGAAAGGVYDAYRHMNLDNGKDDTIESVAGMQPGGSSRTEMPKVQPAQAMQLAREVSAKTGIPAELMWDQWAHETGGFTHIAAPNNLAGIRLPGTKTYQSFNSLEDFGARFADILKEKRYSGIEGAKDIASYAHQLKAGGYYEDSEKNYVAGMTHFDRSYQGGGRASPTSSMTIGSVTIQITQRPGENAQELARRTVAALHEAQGKQVQRNLQEFNNQSWSYAGG